MAARRRLAPYPSVDNALYFEMGELMAAPVTHLTVRERADLGKAARASVPRIAHAEWEPPANRPDPVALLEEQGTTRVADLVPIRYGRMLASPFAFYRGGALIMASDLSGTPSSGLDVQACGDAHLSNFGLFGSPERRLVFDINDFDETHTAPWEWDVKRLAASIEIAGRANGFSRKERRAAVLVTVEAYRQSMREFAAMGNLDVWYLHAEIQEGMPRASAVLDAKSLAQAQKVVQKALTRDSRQALTRLSTVVDGTRKLLSDPPLIVPVDELFSPDQAELLTSTVLEALRIARETLPDDRRRLLEQYRVLDVARKVVGVGSVGTRAWVLLMVGRDEDDVLMLQAKEAEASVLERFTARSRYRNHGRRVVEGQRRMQATSDVFLSWSRVEQGVDGRSHDYYVRQLRDWKGSWDPATMNPLAMGMYGRMCGWTLARAHARTGDRVAIASYLGAGDAFDRAIVEFSELYAEQNDRDHASVAKAVADGRLTAQSGI